ncbi:hypothetical protein [Psychrobacillus sp. FSL H8-0487]|uniref:hypothetical protein n=1 Tax=Psychrobacillus sp. FSL H8-0487 TaxID=2921391 RepID=UPI0030FD20EC
MSNTWMIFFIGLIPVVIGILIVLYITKKVKYKGSLRLNKIVIIIYFSLLIGVGVVYEILPKEPKVEQLSEEQLQQLQTENEVFEAKLLKQEESKLSQKFLKEEWTHELSGNTLTLGYIGNDSYSTKVVVEWIDSTAQKIEGKVYRSHINLYGLKIEDKIPLHEAEWKGNELVIHEPVEQEFTFDQLSNELNVFQQTDTMEIRMVRGFTYIHLKVPKHIEVVDPLGLQMY